MDKLNAIRRGSTSLLIAAGIVVGAPPVIAQQGAGALEEVIVTARYREEALQDTPLAITAITAEDIQVRGFTSAYEIGYAIPNASLRPAQAAFGNTMTAYIRGIGQYDFIAEFEPGVGIYIDDVYHPFTMGSMIDLLDLERVEVLRGPQGTLFGRGSLGGAIRYVSKKPQGDNTGFIQATGGSYDRIDLRAGYDFSILEDQLFARITGVSKSRDGYQDVYDFHCAHPNLAGTIPQQVFNRTGGCKTGTQGGEDVQAIRGTLRWVPQEDFEVTVSTDFNDDNSEARADTLTYLATNPSGPFAGQLPVPFNFWSAGLQATYGVPYDSRFLPPDIYKTYATYDDPVTGISFEPVTSMEQWGAQGKLDWTYSEQVRAEAIIAYRELSSKFATDADGSPYNEQTVDGRQEIDYFTAEFRLSGRVMDRLDYTLGFFHYEGSFQSGQTVLIPAFVPAPFLVNGLNITESENNSVFAHGVFDITDRIAFTAGVRYSEDTKDEQFDNTIVTDSKSVDSDSFDYKIGLDFKATDDILIYASTATGYRPPAFNPRPFQITQFVPVDGEDATSYDIGVKADLFDQTLRLNVAGFYIDYSQRILPVGGTECLLIPGSDPPMYNLNPAGLLVDFLGNRCDAVTSRTFYQNVPAEITGAEVEGQWRPVEGLTVSGVFGYTDFSGDEFDDPTLINNPPGTQVLSDKPIYVPEINWSVAIQYEYPLNSGATITPRIDVYGQTEICSSFRSDFTFVNSPAAAPLAETCTDSYELLNARVEFRSPSDAWTVAVGANNVTDEEYFLNKFDLSAFGQPTIEGQPGRPLEWYVTVRRNF
jgi:iron complex outermembrane receptor protein